jgi:imidazolonepropionase-like amidohydrolase
MIAVKTYGTVVDKMIIKNPVGMKAAFGENPKRVYNGKGKLPTTRMGTAAALREALVKALNYCEKLDRGQEDPEKGPERDLKMEALVPVVRGELPLRAHAHRADDIMTALRIADEFELKIVIEHCTEGHIVAEELASRGVPAIVGPTLSNRSKIELKDKSWLTPITLMKAGVKVALMTDHPVIPIEQIRIAAALVAREGLDLDETFRAITINPAEIAGISDRVGSLVPGKDADIVVWSAHPLEAKAKAEVVLINGSVVHRSV